MKTKILCVFVTLILSTKTFAQFPQELLQFSAFIKLKPEGTKVGTGFFLADTSKFYLVTAKHVLMEKDTLKAKLIDVEYYYSNPSKTISSLMKVYLNVLWDKKKIFYNSKDDIIVIELGKIDYNDKVGDFAIYENDEVKLLGKTQGVKGYKRYNILKFDSVEIGNDVFSIGYPTDVTSKYNFYEYNRPMLRKGAVAGKDEIREYIVTDCFTNGGNSGGPVLYVKKVNTFIADYKLIGITIGYPPDNNANVGYSVVEPIDKILKLIPPNK